MSIGDRVSLPGGLLRGTVVGHEDFGVTRVYVQWDSGTTELLHTSTLKVITEAE